MSCNEPHRPESEAIRRRHGTSLDRAEWYWKPPYWSDTQVEAFKTERFKMRTEGDHQGV